MRPTREARVHPQRLRYGDHKYDDADNSESKTAGFCLLHAQSQHGSVSARSCSQPGCSKQPVLGLHGGGKAVLCAQHTIDRSAKVCVRRCPEREAASKHRNFVTLTVNLAESCSFHATEEMVDLRTKRCSHVGCAAPATVCGVRGTRHPDFCSTHAEGGLV